jgi:salicylate hydroxylase
LLKAIPKEMMHTSKKLVKIDSVATGEILLSFQDGSKEYVDALIGADGVHGYVREYVLGAGHPALNPTFAGFWDCRSLVPIEKARELLGDEYFKEARQYAWSGNGGFFMHDVLDNGQTIQCVASVMTDEEWHPDSWKRDIDRRTLEETFATWTNSPVVKGMIEVSFTIRSGSSTDYTLAVTTREPRASRICTMGS